MYPLVGVLFCTSPVNYYNDISPEACAWLRELIVAKLIPQGHVDQRSIADVTPTDLAGYTQCHFFAGIGGWSYALHLAGWPATRTVWTGSCPCQPFSCAGRGLGEADPRHLWPQFRRLISECKPATIFGEQVASKAGCEWLSRVRGEMEDLGYAFGAARLPALCVGAKHFRSRFYFVADSVRERLEGLHSEAGREPLQPITPDVPAHNWQATPRVLERINGISKRLDRPPLYREQIIGYGNAIVPQVAAEFIKAYIEATV